MRTFAAGRHSPGILPLRDRPLIELAEHLLVLAYASEAQEWTDRIAYIP
jgi:hypothetical protein